MSYKISVEGTSKTFVIKDTTSTVSEEFSIQREYVLFDKDSFGKIGIRISGANGEKPTTYLKGVDYTKFIDGDDNPFASADAIITWARDNVGFKTAPGGSGVGIDETIDNGDGTFTWKYSDGTEFTTSDLTGPKGDQGDQGIQGPQGENALEGILWEVASTKVLGTTDADKMFYNTTENDYTFTVPLDSSVHYEDDITFGFKQEGSGRLKVLGQSGVSMIDGQTGTDNRILVIARRGIDNWVWITEPDSI